MSSRYNLNVSIAKFIGISSLVTAEVITQKGSMLRTFGFSPSALIHHHQVTESDAQKLNKHCLYLTQEETLFVFL